MHAGATSSTPNQRRHNPKALPVGRREDHGQGGSLDATGPFEFHFRVQALEQLWADRQVFETRGRRVGRVARRLLEEKNRSKLVYTMLL